MIAVAVCGEEVEPAPGGAIQHMNLHGRAVTCGLVSVPDADFEDASPEHRNSVLVETEAFSCNYRDRWLICAARRRCVANACYVIGSELCGRVVAVGRDVEELRVGDRIIGDNDYSGPPGPLQGVVTNHASRKYHIFHRSRVAVVPTSWSSTLGAAFSVGAQTAYSMIRRAELPPGATVLVTSARSNTSLFLMNALRARGHAVYAATSSTGFEPTFLAMGVKRVVSLDDDWARTPEIREIVERRGGFDGIFDPFGDLHFARLVPWLCPHGRYVTCGVTSRDEGATFPTAGELANHNALAVAILRDATIVTNCLGRTDDLRQAIRDFTAGLWDVVIDSTFSNGDVAGFLSRTFEAKERFGKVVFTY